MPNFCRLMVTTWETQSLELFASEFRDSVTKHLTTLYPNNGHNKFGKKSSQYLYGVGESDSKVSLRLNMSDNKTVFHIQFNQINWNKEISLLLTRDSRFFSAINETPSLLFEIILDEFYNYISSLYVTKSRYNRIHPSTMRTQTVYDNEVILTDNFTMLGMEPVRFMIPGEIMSPSTHSPFDFVLALQMKPYLFTDKVFELPHFIFMFYNDKRVEAYDEWRQEIEGILKKKIKY